MKIPFLALLSLAILFPEVASAHVGVGSASGFMHGVMHPIGGLDHLLAMLAVGIWAAQVGGRIVWMVPTTFVTVMVLAGALGFAGFSVPYVEEGILLSVLVLGLLIAGAYRFSPVFGVLLVGLFAVFHGIAHGTEAPMQTGLFLYAAGFAFSTALLHIAGLGVGLMAQKASALVVRFAGGAVAFGGVYMALA